MTAIAAIAPPGVDPSAIILLTGASPAPAAAPAAPAGVAFGEMLGQGMKAVEDKVAAADDMVRAFALDESVPIHQVTIALEEARLAVDLALQVRTRLVEAYREIMNTQL